MGKIEEYVAAQSAWQEAMQGVVSAQGVLSAARVGEATAYRALTAITQSLSPTEVAEAEKEWRSKYQEPI